MANSIGLKKGILYVLFANAITLMLNLITNFLLPRFLSIDAYAGIKTFQLYINYIGVLHLGYVDGIYLKYGGKAFEKIDTNELAISVSTLRCFQVIISLFSIVISIILNDGILLAFSLATVPLNLTAYFRMLYQATGMFDVYSKVVNIVAIATFFANCLLVGLRITDNFSVYLLAYVILDIIVWLILEIRFSKSIIAKHKLLFSFNYKELVLNIKTGFALMLGNFASFVLTGMDRWFVKFLMTTQDFAQYSFAVSLENMLNMVITPITIPLYNYFCREKDIKKIRNAVDLIIAFSIYLISAAFIVEVFVNLVLENYRESIPVVYLLFASQGIQVVLKAVFVNLYKVRFQQKIYMTKLIIVLISGAIFNAVCFYIMRKMSAFAWGTLMSSALWLLLTIPDFKDLQISPKKWGILFIVILEYLFLGYSCNPLVGLMIHLAISTFVVAIIYKKAAILIMGMLRNIMRTRG